MCYCPYVGEVQVFSDGELSFTVRLARTLEPPHGLHAILGWEIEEEEKLYVLRYIPRDKVRPQAGRTRFGRRLSLRIKVECTSNDLLDDPIVQIDAWAELASTPFWILG